MCTLRGTTVVETQVVVRVVSSEVVGASLTEEPLELLRTPTWPRRWSTIFSVGELTRRS